MTNAEEAIAAEALKQFWVEHKPVTDALGLVDPSINEARMAKHVVSLVEARALLADRVTAVEAKQAAKTEGLVDQVRK